MRYAIIMVVSSILLVGCFSGTGLPPSGGSAPSGGGDPLGTGVPASRSSDVLRVHARQLGTMGTISASFGVVAFVLSFMPAFGPFISKSLSSAAVLAGALCWVGEYALHYLAQWADLIFLAALGLLVLATVPVVLMLYKKHVFLQAQGLAKKGERRAAVAVAAAISPTYGKRRKAVLHSMEGKTNPVTPDSYDHELAARLKGDFKCRSQKR